MSSKKHFRFSLSVLLFAAIACSKPDENKPELSAGVLKQNMDTTVRPGDNFTAYVSGAWVKTTEIPADKAAYGIMHILNDKAQEDVKAIIEESAAGNFPDGSDEQKVGDLHESFMNTKVRDSLGTSPLQPQFAKIDAIKNYEDLATYFGYASKMANLAPFSISVLEDFKNPKAYMAITWQGGLGLPDRDYYFNTDAKSKETRDKYVQHIEKMLTLGGIKSAKSDAAKIMKLETTLAGQHMKKELTREMTLLYNKYSVKDLSKLMPDFNWEAFLKEAEVAHIDSLVVAQVDYTKALNNIIKSTPIETWKIYLRWSLIHGTATILNTALDAENFEFYGKTLYGVQQQKEQWRRSVDNVNYSLGEIVGKVYVKKHFSPEAKERMLVLVKNLLKAYEASIKELDWMGEETKKQALDKLSKFTPKIGYPDQWRDYSKLKIVRTDLFGNMVRSTLFEYQRHVDKLGKPVDRNEWLMTPQEINAYYNPPLNEIVFPAAILQPPFFDMSAEDAVNYGAIGAVIGHEIGHGFDDQGSTFDGNGVMRNWWTDKDKEEFKKRTGALVAQYDQFLALPDLHVNGTFTLGENIGDLGGLSIALKAYHISLGDKPAPVLDGFTGEQRLFIGWAQVWANKYRSEALRNMIATNPHSPAHFRVNGVVRNIPEFYSAFNVQATDSLYLAPESRVKIW